jgi:hypothetical protein
VSGQHRRESRPLAGRSQHRAPEERLPGAYRQGRYPAHHPTDLPGLDVPGDVCILVYAHLHQVEWRDYVPHDQVPGGCQDGEARRALAGGKVAQAAERSQEDQHKNEQDQQIEPGITQALELAHLLGDFDLKLVGAYLFYPLRMAPELRSPTARRRASTCPGSTRFSYDAAGPNRFEPALPDNTAGRPTAD